jgi:hypothetical protein
VAGCKTSVIPEGIKAIGPYAFADCYLTGALILPESVEAIYGGAFAGENELSHMVISQGVKSIKKCAFEYCSPIVYNTLEKIEFSSFWECCLYVVGDYEKRMETDWKFNALLGDDYANAIFGCQVAYDGEVPYVYAIDWRADKQMMMHSASSHCYVPTRAGYRFLGWATEEGSQEVVYGIVYVGKEDYDFNLGDPTSPMPSNCYLTLCKTEGCKVPTEDTMLYAVWEKIEEKNEG